MARWRVDIIRKRAEHLGTVEAASKKEAIEKAAKKFDIPRERRNRIVVQKIGATKDYGRGEGRQSLSSARTTAPATACLKSK